MFDVLSFLFRSAVLVCFDQIMHNKPAQRVSVNMLLIYCVKPIMLDKYKCCRRSHTEILTVVTKTYTKCKTQIQVSSKQITVNMLISISLLSPDKFKFKAINKHKQIIKCITCHL